MTDSTCTVRVFLRGHNEPVELTLINSTPESVAFHFSSRKAEGTATLTTVESTVWLNLAEVQILEILDGDFYK